MLRRISLDPDQAAPSGWHGILARATPLWAWLVLAISLLGTAGLWSLSAERERQEAALRVQVLASRLSARIVERLSAYEQILRGGVSVFDTWGDVSRQEWRSYVARLDLPKYFPGVQGIGFAESVRPEEVAQHEARLRAEGFPDYSLTPKGDRPAYSAIIYLEPFDWRNRRAFGYDMLSEPIRRAAMERARDSAEASISGKVTLVQETVTDRQAGFLMYLPVYRGGGVPETIEERRRLLRGFVYAPFRAGDFMRDTIDGETDRVRLQLFDGERPRPESLLFDSHETGPALESAAGFLHEAPIRLGDHVWTIRLASLAAPRGEFLNSRSWLIASGGVVISALLFVITWSIARSNVALRDREAKLRYLFERNPSAMWVYDRRTLDIMEVNTSAAELYGYTREEFLKLNLANILVPEDLERFRHFVATRPEGLRNAGEWRHRTRDGRVLLVDLTSHTLRFAEREAALVVARDVTDRRRAQAALMESEKRFRSIANSMPAMLWLGDARGRTAFVNRSCTEYTGRTVEDLAADWLSLVHPDDRPQIEARVRAARAAREPYSNQYRLRRWDGVYRWFLDHGVPRFDDAGELVGYIGVLLDITDLREAQAQLQQAQRIESVGRLTGGIAHDFNNLLTVIQGNAEALVEDDSTMPHQRKLAEMVFAAAERAAELTRGMLAFARRQTLTPKLIDLNDTISGMAAMLRRALPEDIDIRFEKSADLWPTVVDAAQLEAAILNLVINARDAMPGGGRITVATSNVTLGPEDAAQDADIVPGDYVMLAVSDTGTGIPPEVLGNIFEPFFTTKPVGRGTGLGLSTVFGFVKQSGGHIKVETEKHVGTTFRLYLPRDTADVEETASPQADEAIPRGSERILVAEDEPLVRSHVESQLRSLGYDVVSVENGSSALTLIERDRSFDLLLSDIVMPGGMSGPELAERAQELQPGLKVLFMSGYAEAALIDHSKIEVGTRLLNKPFRRLELATKLREVLGDQPGLGSERSSGSPG